jgi:hypothetical protein
VRPFSGAVKKLSKEGRFFMMSTDDSMTAAAPIPQTEVSADRVDPKSASRVRADSATPNLAQPVLNLAQPAPLRFSDTQLDQIMRCAAPLHPRVRIAFIEAVAHALRGKVVGDGSVYLACREVLRDSMLFDPPELGSGRPTKWDR